MRTVVDLRALNAAVDVEEYPFPTVEETVATPGGRDLRWITTMDLKNAFWQVPLAEESQALTTFATRTQLYKYTCVPQGLVTASHVFNAVASMALGHLKHLHTIFVDDLDRRGGVRGLFR